MYKNSFLKNKFSNKKDVEKKILFGEWDDQKIEEKYIGCYSIRPLPSFNVSKTLLPLDTQWISELDTPWKKGTSILSCKIKSERINLLGRNIKLLNLVPFVQQDPIIGACSAASMWVVSYIFYKNYNTSLISYSKISSSADQLGIQSPKSELWINGHNIYQIHNTLKKCGISAYIFRGINTKDWLNTIYSFVKSGFPVLLGLKNLKYENKAHAVTLIGNYIEDKNNVIKLIKQNNKLKSQFILCKSDLHMNYYSHDDSYGPYNKISFECDKNDKMIVYRSRMLESKNKYQLKSAVLCLPSDSIKVFPNEVIETTRCLCNKLFENLINDLKETKKIILQTNLITSNNFKKSIFIRQYNNEFIRYYNISNLPHYIWLVEIIMLDMATKKEVLFGEILYDSTNYCYKPLPLAGRILHSICTFDNDGEFILKNPIIKGNCFYSAFDKEDLEKR